MKYNNIYDEIVATYYNEIKYYCLKKTNNKADAEDCAQDVFFMLWQKRKKIDFGSNIKAWLYRAADNIIKDCLRKKAKHPDLSLAEVEDEPVSDEEAVIKAKLDDALEFLKPDEHELITDYYVKKKSADKLAKYFNISKNAFYQRISRIKDKILKHLGINKNDKTSETNKDDENAESIM